jgi:hypothetical protein
VVGAVGGDRVSGEPGAGAGEAPVAEVTEPASAARPALVPLGGVGAVCDGDTCTIP